MLLARGGCPFHEIGGSISAASALRPGTRKSNAAAAASVSASMPLSAEDMAVAALGGQCPSVTNAPPRVVVRCSHAPG